MNRVVETRVKVSIETFGGAITTSQVLDNWILWRNKGDGFSSRRKPSCIYFRARQHL